MNPQILIVGAGPTGLVLAVSLAKRHVPFTIIDKKSGPEKASRAMAVVPRTLEFYDQFGFAEEFLQGGIKMEDVSLRVEGEEKASFHIGDLGKGLSRFPSPLTYPQDEHEKFLLQKLDELGVHVKWNTELISLHEREDDVEITIKKNGQKTLASFCYVCGCDGASSVVRHQIKMDFEGGTYEQEFYVMDIDAEGPQIGSHQMGMCLNKEEFALFLPVRSSETTRAIGVLPSYLEEREDVSPDQVVSFMELEYQVKVKKVHWFSTYRVHHRIAERFRQGRVFLAGDAAHVHSPVGGQGMNTGIGDALNLGWKLAAILQYCAKPSLLDSYEIERKAFAKKLVKTTDQAFKRVVSKSTGNKILRKRVIPALIPLLNRSAKLRKKLFQIVSQIRIEYSESPLSKGKDAGSRLPYTGTNFASLRSLDWQIHIYGKASTELERISAKHHLLLKAFPYDIFAKQVGLEENALYLIRPDGHLGFVHREQSVQELEAYLNEWGIVSFRG